jgi:DNA transformation protein
MPVSDDFHDYILEQLSAMRAVVSRRMFGGVGLYCDGLFFGLIDDDVLYLKVDDSNRPDYTTRGMEPFRPFKDKPLYSMTYFQVPAEVLEDAEQLVEWSRKACAVALGSRGDRGTTQGRSRQRAANKKVAQRRTRRSRK